MHSCRKNLSTTDELRFSAVSMRFSLTEAQRATSDFLFFPLNKKHAQSPPEQISPRVIYGVDGINDDFWRHL